MKFLRRWRYLSQTCAIAPVLLFAIAPALAQTASPATPPTTQDVTLNLIHLLVQENIITATQADALFTEAKKEAGSAGTPATPTKTIHVTYVPEVIRQQIVDQTKREVLKESPRSGGFASAMPEWMRRITITGDFRMRYERQFEDGANGPALDYNTINQSSTGIDANFANETPTGNFPPTLNTTENRSRERLRARIEFDDRVNNDTVIGLRLTTGDNTNPVSPNQTLGANFDPYAVNIDRAFLRYTPDPYTKLLLGRFASPWLSTDLIWNNDLNFDGVAAQYNREIATNVRPFITAGVFPVENTALSFPSLSPDKVPSRDKWLYAVQMGVSWLPADDYLVKLGAAYYDFAKIQGEESSPCATNISGSPCDTDNTRAVSLQHGNSVFPIRTPEDPPYSGNEIAEYQYYGLASPFRVADLTLRFDIAQYAPIHITFNGDAAYNTAYDAAKIAALSPDNNTETGSFKSGPFAFGAGLTIGMPEMHEFGDWNTSLTYKYLEADSVVDAFNDSDFHGGGTNAKGYILRGNMGLAHNLWLSGNFFSATEVSGLPYAEDTLQMDVNARF